MKLQLFILTLISILLTVNPGFGKSPKPKEITLLIVDGFSNHDWVRTTQAIVHILTKYKGFNIEVTTSPDKTAAKEQLEGWIPNFSAFDVVMLNCNDLGGPVNWSKTTRENLESFVASGGGLYIFHSANNSFENWGEYNRNDQVTSMACKS